MSIRLDISKLSLMDALDLASLIEVKGEFTGRPRLDAAPDQQLAELGAQLYLNLDHTNLAAWRTWLDFPVPVSTGHGGLRLWADWRGKGQSGSGQFTADVALEKLHLQFPLARIDFLLRKGNEGLLANHPFVEKVWIWEKNKRR